MHGLSLRDPVVRNPLKCLGMAPKLIGKCSDWEKAVLDFVRQLDVHACLATVKKYLRAGDEQRRYAKRTSSSKLDLYAQKLATVLAIEALDRASKRHQGQIFMLAGHALQGEKWKQASLTKTWNRITYRGAQR